MGGGGRQKSDVKRPLSGIDLQTSQYGLVVPVVYGTRRITGNLIYYPAEGFRTYPNETRTGSGKGGGGGNSEITYLYSAVVIFGLCEGTILGVGDIWADKELTTATAYRLGIRYGNEVIPWDYLTTHHPSDALVYAGTAAITSPAVPLTDTAAIPNLSYEVEGLLSGGVLTPDANGSDVLKDFLSNERYGVGWVDYSAADWGQYEDYCAAADFGISPAMTEAQPARDWIEEWLLATNSQAVWGVVAEGGGMTLRIVPYGDEALTGNGATFTPDVAPVYNLSVANGDFIVDSPGDAPIKVTRKSIADTYNSIPVNFKDRSIGYNDNSIDSPIQSDVAIRGERIGSGQDLHCITRESHAVAISRALALRSLSTRNEYSFKLGMKYSLIEPMDRLTITDDSIGVYNQTVLIRSVEETDDLSVEVEAVEWPAGVGNSESHGTEGGAGGGSAPVPPTVDPGNASAPTVIDVPVLFRVSDSHEVLVGSSSLSNDWGGCQVWVSEDDATYAYGGTISKKARTGVLTATLATSAVKEDATNTLRVDLSSSGGELTDTTEQGTLDLLTLSYCDGEFLAYQDATLTGANAYDLGTLLRRGAVGTDPAEHLSGTVFARIDDAFIRLPVPESRIGQLMYIKLLSFNSQGGGLQELADVSASTFTPTAQYAPAPTGVTIDIT